MHSAAAESRCLSPALPAAMRASTTFLRPARHSSGLQHVRCESREDRPLTRDNSRGPSRVLLNAIRILWELQPVCGISPSMYLWLAPSLFPANLDHWLVHGQIKVRALGCCAEGTKFKTNCRTNLCGELSNNILRLIIGLVGPALLRYFSAC